MTPRKTPHKHAQGYLKNPPQDMECDSSLDKYPKFAFTLETYATVIVTPAPNILPKEVDITQTAPVLLTTPDFSKTGVKSRKRTNEESPYFNPIVCLDQQDLSVRVISNVWKYWSGLTTLRLFCRLTPGHENRIHDVPDSV